MHEPSTSESRSAMLRPARIVLGAIGRVRNRSITPVARSLLMPTAVPGVAVTRIMVRRPATANSL
jgi:hypothetical protein